MIEDAPIFTAIRLDLDNGSEIDGGASVLLRAVDDDPRTGSGVEGNVGTVAFSSKGGMYIKNGNSDTDWGLSSTFFIQSSKTSIQTVKATPSNRNDITKGIFPATYLELTTPDLGMDVSTKYKLDLSYSWSLDSTSQDFLARINRNHGTQLFGFHRQEPKDASGSGGDGPTGSGTNQRHWANQVHILESLTGVQVFELEFAASRNNVTATLISATFTFERI